MASRVGPRSVKDATRFTSTIPHATAKQAATPSSAAARASVKPSNRLPGETPEQRVRRLRAAHLAAQNARISRTDRIIDSSRRFLDAAHRFTVGGVVLFTGERLLRTKICNAQCCSSRLIQLDGQPLPES